MTERYTKIVRFFAWTTLVAAGLLPEAHAIITRHDRDDQRYLRMGEEFPEVGYVGDLAEGTLIAPQWVLTASHVAVAIADHPWVRFGKREYRIQEIFMHPHWREGGDHDVALLLLREPVDGITPAALYTLHDEVGQIVWLVGQGDYGTGLSGPQANDGQRRAGSNICSAASRKWLRFDMNDPRDGDDGSLTDLEGISGPGDSGGPAFIEKYGRHFIAGISAYGAAGKYGRGSYGERNDYTRVSSYVNWIRDTMDSRPPSLAMANTVRHADFGLLLQSDPRYRAHLLSYFEAFNSGSDADMLSMTEEHCSDAPRSRDPELSTISTYRTYYEALGTATPRQIVRLNAQTVVVTCDTQRGPAEFRFEFNPQAPYRIDDVRITTGL